MNSRTDQELLHDYAKRHSEDAFAQLVRRHVDLVYSATLRMVRVRHLAEDVTQGVFVALARNARQLTDCAVLSGWLYRTAQNLAANAVRTEVRRHAREQESAVMNELLSADPDVVWEHVAPHLDAALRELNDADRDTLLLRYFERKSAREIGERLGLTEQAAQKRVSRALEKLRLHLASRGVTSTAAALALTLTGNAVTAAPPAFMAALASTSLAAAAAGTGTTLTLLKLMTMTKLQAGIIVALVVAGIATTLVLHHQSQQKSRKEVTPETKSTTQATASSPTTSTFWRRVQAARRAREAATASDAALQETLVRLKAALYAPPATGSPSKDPAYEILYAIPLEQRAAALDMVMQALRRTPPTGARTGSRRDERMPL